MGNEQFSNYMESSTRVFKSFETLLNEGNLFSTELLGRIDVITSIMNARPIKRVSKGDAVFTLSPKELVMPFLSSAHILQNLLHAGAQLCQDMSWSDY